MAQFFRINGGSTQFRGVVPDIIYPTAVDIDDEGERSLDNALPWARINALEHGYDNLGPLDRYRRLHQSRAKSDPGFNYLVKENFLLKKIRDREYISLHKKKRKQEWEERKQSRKERKNRFLLSVGITLPNDDDKDETESKRRSSEDDADLKAIRKIGLKEAARILADFIGRPSPRAAMAN